MENREQPNLEIYDWRISLARSHDGIDPNRTGDRTIELTRREQAIAPWN
ncbi:MAG: hypothetical protein RIB93_01245 [Coleofasciculus sp. D1-CHI-01]